MADIAYLRRKFEVNKVKPMSDEEFNKEGYFKNIKGVYPLSKNQMEKFKQLNYLNNGNSLEERKKVMKARNLTVDLDAKQERSNSEDSETMCPGDKLQLKLTAKLKSKMTDLNLKSFAI